MGIFFTNLNRKTSVISSLLQAAPTAKTLWSQLKSQNSETENALQALEKSAKEVLQKEKYNILGGFICRLLFYTCCSNLKNVH